ncbi:MAG: cation:proton antiporter [Sulfolobaceae archaeon]|nr:cation:proton antiporter [Sulfolobaceae archaeon]
MQNEIAILALLLAFAGVLGYLFRLANMSATIGYIITGIIFGSVLHIISPSSSLLQFFSSLGIVLISFEIGINLKWNYLKADLPQLLLIIFIETVLVGLATFILSRILNLNLGDSLAIIFAAINTSTIITFKFLDEKGMLSITKMRNLLLGLASMEDIVSLLELSIYPILVEGGNPIKTITALNYVILSILSAGLLGFLVIRRIFKRSLRLGLDLAILLTMSVLMFSILVSPLFNISAALLALIFGISFSMDSESEVILNNIKPFGELFYAIFFVSVGAEVQALPSLAGFVEIAAMIIFIIFVKYVGTVVSLATTGISIKDSLTLSIYLLPISEFGIVIAAFGLENGYVSQLVYLGIILTIVSSYIVTSLLSRNEKIIINYLGSNIPITIENFFKKFSVIQETLTKKNEIFQELLGNLFRKELNAFIPIIVTIYLLLIAVYLMYLYNITSLLRILGSPILLAINILPIYFALTGIKQIPSLSQVFKGRLPRVIGALASISIYVLNVILAFLISIAASNIIRPLSNSIMDYPIEGIVAGIIIITISFMTYRYLEKEIIERSNSK